MNRIIFITVAVVSLAAVAGSSSAKPKDVKTQRIPSVAIEVRDEALEAVREGAKENARRVTR